MTSRSRHVVTIWEKGTVDPAHGDYWVRVNKYEITRAQGRLLQALAYDVGYRGTWCAHRIRPINGRLVSVDEIPR
jgi:hypothetical protein